jgi:hypothetical protein
MAGRPYDVLDVLRCIPAAHEDGIIRGHYNQIFNANGRNQRAFAAQIGIARGMMQHVAFQGVACIILAGGIPQRFP